MTDEGRQGHRAQPSGQPMADLLLLLDSSGGTPPARGRVIRNEIIGRGSSHFSSVVVFIGALARIGGIAFLSFRPPAQTNFTEGFGPIHNGKGMKLRSELTVGTRLIPPKYLRSAIWVIEHKLPAMRNSLGVFGPCTA